jgi:hypothetical protein
MLMVILVLALLGGLVFFINQQPADFKITRSMTMQAQDADIFGHINDLHRFNIWNPWAQLDPNAHNRFTGPNEGIGAIMSWDGKIGQGSMEIVQSLPYSLVQFKMEFLKPVRATNMAEFTLAPEASATHVTWTMSGKNNFINKAMNLVFNINTMVGGQFEKGLSNLKAIVEKPLLN